MKKLFNSKFKTHYLPQEVVPWYKGFWYRDLSSNRVVVTLIGLNVLFRLGRDFLMWLRFPCYGALCFYEDQLELRKKRHEKSL